MVRSSDTDNAKTTLRTAERALAFLEAVALAPRPPLLKEIAAELGLNLTTGYHLLNTLQQAGYISRDDDATLRIGARVAVLHQGMLRHFALGRELRPVIEELRQVTGETAYIAGLTTEGVVIQELVAATHAVGVTGLHVGFTGSEHIRASGKAVLAHLDESRRVALLSRCLGAASPKELDEVMVALAVVRDRGWAADDGDYQDGVCCVAAPFFFSTGLIAGSVAVSAPESRFLEASPALIRAVCTAGERASARLGYDLPADSGLAEASGRSASPSMPT
jgi:IclR family transcriptional regulator, acetate operon repressor